MITRKLSFRSRRFLLCLMGIVAAAFVVRLAVSFQLKEHYPPVALPSVQTDNFTYIQKGLAIADGRYDYSQGFYYQPFYYAVYLPVVFKVFGGGDPRYSDRDRYKDVGYRGVLISQSLLGALTVLICGLLGALVFGRRCGLLTAAILALARAPIFYSAFTLIATLQGFLLSLMVLLAVVAVKKNSPLAFAGCGLVAGMANLTRGNIILLLPVILVIIGWIYRNRWKTGILNSALLIALFVLPQLPFSIVNYRVHDQWVGPSSAGPAVLALGNTPEAPPGGREPEAGAGPMAYPPSYGLWMAQHEAEGDAHVSMTTNITRWILNSPGAWLELKFRMLLLFWNRLEIPNNVSLLNAPSTLLHLPLLLDFWLIGSLGLAGALCSVWRYRKKPTVLLLGGTLVVYTLSIVLFYILARFRLPAVPLICIFSAYTLDLLWRRRHRLVKRSMLAVWATMVLSFLIICIGYQLYRVGWEPLVMNLVRPDGVHISFPDKQTVKDHGPMEFGGWSPVELTSCTIQKTLMLDNHSPKPSELGAVSLRLFIVAPNESVMAVIPRQGGALDLRVTKGPQWIQVELPRHAVVYDTEQPGKLELDFTLKSLTATPFRIYIDNQRDYQRSQVNGKPVNGEVVIEAELHFKPNESTLSGE